MELNSTRPQAQGTVAKANTVPPEPGTKPRCLWNSKADPFGLAKVMPSIADVQPAMGISAFTNGCSTLKRDGVPELSRDGRLGMIAARSSTGTMRAGFDSEHLRLGKQDGYEPTLRRTRAR